MKEPESGISYRISGNSKRTVVLLHGYCETRSLWNDLIPQLENYYTVLTPDLPGFGESDILPEGFSIDLVAKQMELWLSNLNIKESTMIGHSLGGYVVLSFAEQFSSKLSGIGLFHSTSFEDSAEKKQNRLKLVDFVQKNGVEKLMSTLIPDLFYKKNGIENIVTDLTKEASQCTPESVIGYALAMRNRKDRREVLYNFTGPKLFIAGEKDIAVPQSDSQEQLDLLDSESKMIVPGIGHMGMFEARDTTFQMVQEFLHIDN